MVGRALVVIAVVAVSAAAHTVFLASPVHACSCAPRDVTPQAVRLSGGAIEGEVIAVAGPSDGDRGEEYREVVVAVSRAVGTDPGPTTTVDAYFADSAACGLSPSVGDEVAYFADTDELNLCSDLRDGLDAVVAAAADPIGGASEPVPLAVVTYDPSVAEPPTDAVEGSDGGGLGGIAAATAAVLAAVLLGGAVVGVRRRSR